MGSRHPYLDLEPGEVLPACPPGRSIVPVRPNSVPLSICLLCCNEKANLEVFLPRVEAVLVEVASQRAWVTAGEVVIVDDGSTDGTDAWLASRTWTVPWRTVRHAKRSGYGAAVRSGLAAATGDVVVYLDGDGQYRVEELPALLALVESGCDVVAGVRTDRQDPFHRLAIGGSYNLLMRQVTGVSFRDVDCGFKVLRRRVVDSLRLTCDGNLVGAELMAKCQRAGFDVRQVPVTHLPRTRGRAKGADLFSIIGSVRELVSAWNELRPPR